MKLAKISTTFIDMSFCFVYKFSFSFKAFIIFYLFKTAVLWEKLLSLRIIFKQLPTKIMCYRSINIFFSFFCSFFSPNMESLELWNWLNFKIKYIFSLWCFLFDYVNKENRLKLLDLYLFTQLKICEEKQKKANSLSDFLNLILIHYFSKEERKFFSGFQSCCIQLEKEIT